MYTEFTPSSTTRALIRCLVHGFLEFGGVPETILFDRMKSVVLETDAQGKPVWNPEFLDFALAFGFVPDLCRRGRAQTKGYVAYCTSYQSSDPPSLRDWLPSEGIVQYGVQFIIERMVDVSKKLACLILVVLCVCASSIGYAAGSARIRSEQKAVYYRSDLRILVDGRPTVLDVEPFIVDPGWIMVPVEFISKELGAAVAWDDASSTFTITTKGTTAQAPQTPTLATAPEQEAIALVRASPEMSRAVAPFKRELDWKAEWVEDRWYVIGLFESPWGVRFVQDAGIWNGHVYAYSVYSVSPPYEWVVSKARELWGLTTFYTRLTPEIAIERVKESGDVGYALQDV
jgi:hypothetical protein